MRNKVTRRDFMKEAVGMSALAIGILTGGCELFQMTTRKIQSRPVRRDISTLSPNDPIILTYKDAVTKMKALPSSDPRNWTRQAEIHNNHCPHGNWYFLPWHRAYLYYFEEICRELTGNNAFALPYWNWTKNPGIPGVFWGGTSNPLFDTTRLLGPGGSIAPEFVGPSVMEDILSEPNFLIFGSSQTASGRLEATPHNNVHTTILGNMGGFMSPLDPVFWTHHNMVECCWVHWNIVRSHPNTNDPAWTDHAFVGNFVDRHGNPADVRVSDTLLYPLLLYRFEECFAGPPGAEDMRAAERRMDLEVFLKRGARVTLDFIEVFEMQGEMDMAIGTSFTRTIPMKRQGIEAMLAPKAKHQLLLLLDGVQMPKNSQSFVRVFVNKADATSNTSIDDPHYAGSFSIFDTRQKGAEKQGQFIVDVTKTIRRLQSMGQLGTLDKIDIQMIAVPVPGAKDESPRIRVDKLRLGISRPVELH